LQSFGKTYNLTGWRQGAMITPASIIKNILAIKQFSTFSACTPMQLALAEGILEHPEFYQNLHKLYMKQNALLREGLKGSRFNLLEWKGSPFQVLDYSQISDEDDHTFVTKLIKEHGIGLIPLSSLFVNPDKGLLRLCFAKKDNTIIEGARILTQI
jgi:methionine aminotransferase